MNRKHENLQENIIEAMLKEALKLKVKSQKELQSLKNQYSLKYKISSPSNVALIRTYRNLVEKGKIRDDKGFFHLIKKRKIRSESGIANITVITKHYKCPGNCIYCPSEPNMPKSYLSNEPAMMRAILNDFDAESQVRNRLSGLQRTGHNTDKIEIIVAGGTFSFYPKIYQTSFVRDVYNALNGKKSRTLVEAQSLNETAQHRCVGLSLETRPDWINIDEIKRMRNLGATKVEIGIQSLDEEVLKMNNRGHGVKEIRIAMKLLKDAGFKINAHIMPNLYGSSIEKDIEIFTNLFEDSDFRPDWLKIYPCVVTPYSQLEKMWRKGLFKSYSDEELIKLMIELKKLVPEYVRIARLYRDIPAESILAGSKISNLRQIVHKTMAETGDRCKCIRCREIKTTIPDPENIKLVERSYYSSDGKEHFLSFEDTKNDKLIAFLRLRIPSQIFKYEKHFIKELSGSSIIRELHTYGEHLPIKDHKTEASQHQGYGKRLIEKAEEITYNYGLNKIAVISGIGVREYYKKRRFELQGTYMVKSL
ncbi:tRNA uridine(34) 5-carboxymethylaminomethyl modification radical SAM/GNAT enzyme Elp3 [Candidatus Peregrinibacteria bacterium]|nr:tRNA uridine(34) 5-carboxymethylaminomethyl modification radical SAM/GNAT enzyme Elp3 [Candidatus Peregrinibacteria bacterium]